jgi:hypothetical protein
MFDHSRRQRDREWRAMMMARGTSAGRGMVGMAGTGTKYFKLFFVAYMERESKIYDLV